MNKLFFVSFVAIVAACPAFAEVVIGPNASTASCDNATLNTYTGPASLNSVWRPAISGAISLDSNRYAANDSVSAASTATTASSPATVYSLYGTGVYSSQPTTSNWTTFTAANRLSALTTSPQMTGYTFGGFYTTKASDGTQLIDSSGNFKYNAASSQISTDNNTATWYARWTPNDYTITFAKNTVDTNGATLVAQDGTTATPTGTMADQTYAYDSTANLTSNAYSLTGYNFEDWYSDIDPTNVNGGSAGYHLNEESVTYRYPGNVTLTAQWYPVNSGAITLISSVYPNNDTSPTPLYTTSTSEAVTPPTTTTVHSLYNTALYSGASGATAVVAANLIPSKVGYTFNGFYNSTQTKQYINGSGVVQGAGLRAVTTGGGTDTWYANWTPITYTITYDCGDGIGPAPITNTSAPYDTLFSPADNTCTRSGYTFAGWLVSGTETILQPGPRAVQWKYTENKTLTAQWTGNNITLTWNPDGGTAQDGTTYAAGAGTDQCTYGGDITMPAVPKKNGYHLLGWDLVP